MIETVLSSVLNFAIFLFLCVTYFYITTAAVTIGTRAALIAWMREYNFIPAGEVEDETTPTENNDTDSSDTLRKIRGED